MKYIVLCIVSLCIICTSSAYGNETKTSWIHPAHKDASIMVFNHIVKDFNIKKLRYFFRDNVKNFNHMIYVVPDRESDGFAKFIFVIEPLQWDDPRYVKNVAPVRINP